MLDKLLRSSKFWFAVYALVQAILAYAVPTFPDTIKTAIDGLVSLVIGLWAVDEVRVKGNIERGLMATRLFFPRAFEFGLAVGLVLLAVGLLAR